MRLLPLLTLTLLPLLINITATLRHYAITLITPTLAIIICIEPNYLAINILDDISHY
jgi:hypothetical protein